MLIHEAKLVYTSTEIPAPPLVDAPNMVVNYMAGAFVDPTVEWFFVILLNRKNRPMGRISIAQGTPTSCLVNPSQVFKPAILSNSPAIVCVHNHPSGDPSPSQADITVTRKLKEVSRVLNIDLLDHVIIGERDCDPCGHGWYSFAEAGLL